MVFQFDFNGPYYDIWMHFEKALVICDWFGLYL